MPYKEPACEKGLAAETAALELFNHLHPLIRRFRDDDSIGIADAGSGANTGSGAALSLKFALCIEQVISVVKLRTAALQ